MSMPSVSYSLLNLKKASKFGTTAGWLYLVLDNKVQDKMRIF